MITKLTHRTNLRRPRRRGFTLTEIAIVLGIVGLILGAIWVAAAAVYNNMRTSHANTEILQLAQAIRGLYATSNIIAPGAETAPLMAAGVVPQDMINGAGLNDPWPSGVTTIWGNAAGDGFEIVMTNVPAAACVALLTQVGGQSGDPGLYDATAVSPSVAGAVADAVVSGPKVPTVTPVIAAGLCGAAPALAKVKFGFGLKS